MTTPITPTDPTAPEAIACLRAYYAELDRTFPSGFYPGPVPGDGLDKMRPPFGTFLLAWNAATPVACVALRGDGSPVGEVKRLWIAEALRGQGLATRLMAAVDDQARTLGMTVLQLDTSRHLPGAVAMYRHYGWTEIPRYNDNPYAHHWFEKRLG